MNVATTTKFLFRSGFTLLIAIIIHFIQVHLFMGNTSSRGASRLAGLQIKMHYKCRGGSYPRDNNVKRYPVKDEYVPWTVNFPEYRPVDYTSPSVLAKPVWADPDFRQENVTAMPLWNKLDGKVDRRSHTGLYSVVDNLPRNPVGRTGVTGRGCLGRWGPNHAADPIVTKWKRNEHGELVKNNITGRPVLQFIAIQRRDSKEWAIPGGMVDPGEAVSVTLKREFGEEALNLLEVSPEQRRKLESGVAELFRKGIEGMVDAGEQVTVTLRREFGEETMNTMEVSPAEKVKINKQVAELFSKGQEVYRGYVDDPRNTDNSWMETVAYNFHDETGDSVGRFKLHAGDDAMGVQWADLDNSIKLFASHERFVEKVAKQHNAHW